MRGLPVGSAGRDVNNHDDFNNNHNANLNNQPSSGREMTLWQLGLLARSRTGAGGMKTFRGLYEKLCVFDNLKLAYEKAKRGKSRKPCVAGFEQDWRNELYKLQWELLTFSYRPRPINFFTVRDPKSRRIGASHFRDRVVHHALVNVLEPIFEPRFICDSFANRKGKGTLAALERFDVFCRMVSRNYRGGPQDVSGFVLKADVRHYFESVDHKVLLGLLRRRVRDEDLLGLVRVILANHETAACGKGMPLGNLTSQFFANVYLASLDEFVKRELRVEHYLRYVDDFVIVECDPRVLEEWQKKIGVFLASRLKLELHPDKTRVLGLRGGVGLLGFRVFPRYRLLKTSNQRRVVARLTGFERLLARGEISREHVKHSLAGWEGYAKTGSTFNFRQRLAARFPNVFALRSHPV